MNYPVFVGAIAVEVSKEGEVVEANILLLLIRGLLDVTIEVIVDIDGGLVMERGDVEMLLIGGDVVGRNLEGVGVMGGSCRGGAAGGRDGAIVGRGCWMLGGGRGGATVGRGRFRVPPRIFQSHEK